MNAPRILFSVAAAMIWAGPVRAADTFDEAMAGATSDYTERLRKAADELNRTRQRIAGEKAPLLQELRAAENRIITAQTEATRFETGRDNAADRRRDLLKELDAIRKNSSYLDTLAHDGLKVIEDGLAPGEEPLLSDRIRSLQQKLDDLSAGPNGRAAIDAAEFLLEQTRRALGGYTASGRSMIEGSNRVVDGTFAFVGPETYFRADDGSTAGTVRTRSGTPFPVTYALTSWKSGDAAGFFGGQVAAVPVDASGGKALKLKETTGSLADHVRKGGVVAYAIIVVGLMSLVMIVQKIRDLARMGVDAPAQFQAFLGVVLNGSPSDVSQAMRELKGMTRELVEVGLRYRDEPKVVLEEHLQATLLRQRLHFERRLPLLAVIATAAPLMGLLGTVIGMVRTFALITVFGTGNAGKLSSGISEVLVATELGLLVAIPTLVAHGFLAHRIQKNLSLLERYSLQLVTAIATADRAADPNDAAEPYSA